MRSRELGRMFRRFFIEPTFAANMVDKEINAVDSEHKKPPSRNLFWSAFGLLGNYGSGIRGICLTPYGGSST